MKADLKRIRFDKAGAQRYFDIVSLSELISRKVVDHNQFENHQLTFYALLVITRGRGIHSVNFKDYDFDRGTVLAIGPDSIHKFHRGDAEGVLLVFTEDFLLQHFGEKNAPKIFQLFNEHLAPPKQQLSEADFIKLQFYIKTITEEFQHDNDNFSLEVIGSLLHIIVTQLLRIKSSENVVFTRTKYLSQYLVFQALIEKHSDQQLSVADYANKLCITSRSLNNITNSIVSKSAKAVVDEAVIFKVKCLLINSESTIAQIAFKTGFKEPSHLSKFFKKLT
ncbi:MAG: AraC family transcriptional regulator, partial [Bacteroidota bacterium]